MDNLVEDPSQPYETGEVYDQGPASWPETLAVVLLFLGMCAYLIIEEIPVEWVAPENFPLRSALIWALVLLAPIGVAIGWIKNFPRWTYAYIGAVPFCLYLPIGYTPYFVLFGWPLFSSDPPGWWTWIPLLLACGAGLLITRSFHPLFVLVDRAYQDTTLITYALFGTMPFWAAISFDEIDRLYSLPWMVALALLMAGAALAYLRSRSLRKRVASLSAGVILSLTIMTLGPMLYLPESGWVDVNWAITAAVFLAGFMLAPSFFDLARERAGLRVA